ncbi:AAA family ATPase [Acinetobacter pittii]|uniref:ATP-dependent nuclease n=1 Tax=Acinetobacter pittii TaxID=48296 RepID=UPI00083FC9DE|nr:AAA family ATPase [Acinetobacter pittii]MCE5999866.1 AAA family ATPase [Acinetobacter pittii]ODL93112.1 ATP-dependent endonuclease [Acinetobacter pittii]SSV83356.1 endonuclease [Acinetobacter pittii]
MGILLDTVRISGFRGISNLEMTLSKVTVLLGENNAGKTSVIKALQLALGDYSRFLSDEDFHINQNTSDEKQIIIDVRFIPFEEEKKENFSEDWQQAFEDKIQSQADGQQFVVIRTIAKPDLIKGGYTLERYHLDNWPSYDSWQITNVNISNKLKKKLDFIPFISIDAQRDIHSELKEKSSFIGRILTSIEYSRADVASLEQMIATVNNTAIEKSDPLQKLKIHLDALNQSLNSQGTTELTPFPKKIRDFSKRFSVHYGSSADSSFSMEYHGMGTRSWASMLSVKAFSELLVDKHTEEMEPLFPIMAAEEPEAHLHPNAQRTLYKQLINSHGQVIISSHSPYIAGLAEVNEIRYLKIIEDSVKVFKLRENFEGDNLRKIKREVIHSRGELLFSRAIVLSEGETEDQVLPLLFETYCGKTTFELGINFVAVNGSGAKYLPFLILAKDFDIPVFIFSDGESKTVQELKTNYEKVFGSVDLMSCNNITILNNTDFEGYLLEQNYTALIEHSIKLVNGENFIENWIERKNGTPLKPKKSARPPCTLCNQPIFESLLRDYSGDEGRKRAILEILDSSKPQYAKAIAESLLSLTADELPQKLKDLFQQITTGIGYESLTNTTSDS